MGIKNDKALSFVRAIQGRWKGADFSQGEAILRALPGCVQMRGTAGQLG